jgi:hypothetical protein
MGSLSILLGSNHHILVRLLIKSHINISTLDLFGTWPAMKPAIANQLKKLNYIRPS